MKYLSRTIIALAIGLASLSGVAANGSVSMVTTVLAKMGQPVGLMNDEVLVTPLEVVEDSRCPRDFVCIWEGQLIVKVRVAHHGKVQELNLTQGAPVYLEDIGTLTLSGAGIRDVGPDPLPAGAIPTFFPEPSRLKDYEFFFTFNDGLRHDETCRNSRPRGMIICHPIS